MKFSKHDDINGTEIVMKVLDDSTLDEVLDDFMHFLRACGYRIEYNQCLVLENMDD